jgi:hypothetical protein
VLQQINPDVGHETIEALSETFSRVGDIGEAG